MDSTPEVKDKKEEEKKKAGFLANLVGSPAKGGAGLQGLGGAAGSGSSLSATLANMFAGTPLAGRFASGGLLATKAGLIGLLLVASAVAGGMGLIGYKLFGPGAADKTGGSYSLFSARPAEEQRQIEAERAAADGVSKSLDYLAKANAGDAKASDAQAADAAAPSDAPAAAASASPSVVPPVKNSGDVTGNKAAKLAASKFGGGSKMSLGGGGGGGSGASMSLAGPAARANGGKISAMGGSSPRGSAGTRGLARKLGGRGAMAQLKGVQRDQRGATSSAGAGSTYDGGPRGIGGGTAATDPGPAGVGDSANTPNDTGFAQNQFPDPPQPQASGWATPWQAAINTAAMAIMAGAALLFLAAKVKDTPGYGTALAYALCAAAALAGAIAIQMGAQISGGEYGQKLQGGMFMASGAALVATSGLMIWNVAAGSSAPAMLNYLIVFSGMAALGTAAVGFLSTPKKYPPWKFENGRAPDWDHKDPKTNQGGGGIFGIGGGN